MGNPATDSQSSVESSSKMDDRTFAAQYQLAYPRLWLIATGLLAFFVITEAVGRLPQLAVITKKARRPVAISQSRTSQLANSEIDSYRRIARNGLNRPVSFPVEPMESMRFILL